MSNFQPVHFFDLSEFQHKMLFDDVFSVWEVLSKIHPYLNGYSLGKIETEIPIGAYLVNREMISVGEGTIVEPGAYIRGPCIIGKNCVIRHGAYIRGDLITGNSCVIGHDTEIKNSILLNGVHAAHFAYIGDSILGNQCNLGAGTKCANLKLDNSTIRIHYEGENITTGLRKMGAIIGDQTQIGCNAVINPGTICGKFVQWYPCTNYGGFIPANSRVKSNATILVVPNKTGASDRNYGL